jgi:hypothetical protein
MFKGLKPKLSCLFTIKSDARVYLLTSRRQDMLRAAYTTGQMSALACFLNTIHNIQVQLDSD